MQEIAVRSRSLQFRLTIDGGILLAVFILANLRATMFIYLHPDTSLLLGPAWIEIFLWFLTTAAVAYQLSRRNQTERYLALWRRNWMLAVFLGLAFISIFWSLGFVETLFSALELFFATLVAAYIGMLYRPSQIMGSLFWFGAILLILSVATVFGAPRTGTMYWAPFYGAWRGIYWHRNHLAGITALLSVVFLCRMLIAWKDRNAKGILDGIFYAFSLIVLVFAKSAAGYILLIVLHFAVCCFWFWLHFFERLQRKHYYIASGIFMAAAVLILLNLDIVFGLFNRSSTLTGRVGLWDYLLKGMVSQRPWWGHGFGAVWTLDAFREQVRQHVGWASQPLIGDNGFLDILLHVGVVGLLIFLIILVSAFIRSFRYAISNKTLEGFFPLVVMIYAVFANISFSLFAETEVFVWFLIVVVLFMTMDSPGKEPLTDLL
jgi:exopolysaccharide production protein ExoQ